MTQSPETQSPETQSSGLVLTAPAKLNLFLHILGRRADGYHELQTAFDLIDWQDTIKLDRRADEQILRTGSVDGLADGEPDLCQRAALALRSATGIRAGVSIDVCKSIPVGAGMGGGSSNAASVLHGLNQLWACGLDTPALAQIGLELGADVPVFVHGHAAFAEGVGEKLQRIDLPARWYLVLVPDGQVSTAAVFADQGLTRQSSPITIADFYAGGHRNDCESVVAEQCPEAAEALHWLRSRFDGRLTGTGSAVFASFANEEQANSALAQVSTKSQGGFQLGCQARVCRGLNQSPLHGQLASSEQD